MENFEKRPLLGEVSRVVRFRLKKRPRKKLLAPEVHKNYSLLSRVAPLP